MSCIERCFPCFFSSAIEPSPISVTESEDNEKAPVSMGEAAPHLPGSLPLERKPSFGQLRVAVIDNQAALLTQAEQALLQVCVKKMYIKLIDLQLKHGKQDFAALDYHYYDIVLVDLKLLAQQDICQKLANRCIIGMAQEPHESYLIPQEIQMMGVCRKPLRASDLTHLFSMV
jgi:hypothetical protein